MLALARRIRSWDPLRLGDSEIELIHAATHRVPIVSRAAARELLLAGKAPGTIPELVSVAAHLGTAIGASPAWSSRYLQPHRARFDVREEVIQIASHAARLQTMSVKLRSEPTGTSTTAELARSAQDAARRQLDVVWATLCRRVAALAEFASHLAQLDAELRNAGLARQALDMDDELAELMTSSVANELAAGQLQHMSDQAAGLAAAIRELVDKLHGDLETLRALAT
ncbi:hypothetical protein NDR87_31220 [Nocardia sp. CDC159]|uniref:Uncharacterized protein n=1 Tax=Nocardia pulmonis TaxID=2951408 RepID=A0A9X2EC26_9NOCA|nr:MULTISPECIES: hypothetical protein [Nocardia]MCM6777977.1 hypothetical protein [Nocardia pulmonis]MCM6790852.1 hypothetical protein [Nocardia sp. CDC159]